MPRESSYIEMIGLEIKSAVVLVEIPDSLINEVDLVKSLQFRSNPERTFVFWSRSSNGSRDGFLLSGIFCFYLIVGKYQAIFVDYLQCLQVFPPIRRRRA